MNHFSFTELNSIVISLMPVVFLGHGIDLLSPAPLSLPKVGDSYAFLGAILSFAFLDRIW
jgi:hypothetical protein